MEIIRFEHTAAVQACGGGGRVESSAIAARCARIGRCNTRLG